MSDSFITIMIVLIAAVLIFVVPVMSLSKRIDVTATQDVQSAVSEFVDKTRKTGMIKQEDYDKLLQELEATGNTYEVNVSIQYIDENPSKKTSSNVLDSIKIGENVYYIEYTTQVEEAFEKTTDGIIKLESGDYIKVDIQNKNQTIYQNFKKTLYNLSGGSVGEIEGVHVGLVIETTDGKQVGTEQDTETEQKYAITYDANGGIQSTCPYSSAGYKQIKNKGENITLSSIKPVHSDSSLKFAGWSENQNDSEPMYISGEIFRKDKNTTLYAVWKKQIYNVVYLSNHPTMITGLPEQDADLQVGATYRIWDGREEPKVEGATFVEWNTSPNGDGISYNSGDIITINESLILYAIWEAELEYKHNIKALIVSYNRDSADNTNWAIATANYMNELGNFEADYMTIRHGELDLVVSQKDKYELIVINATAWSVSGIDDSGAGKEKLIEIANSTNLITFGDDEYKIPLIDTNTMFSTSTYIYPETTERGAELVGETIEVQRDPELLKIKFKPEVTVLYTAKYVSKYTDEDRGTGDLIGFADWGENTNWIHGQILSASKQLTYKLSMIALNGLQKKEYIVNNMPGTEYHMCNQALKLSEQIPIRNEYKFLGWSDSPTGEVKYQPGDEITMAYENMVLYAQWKAYNQYTITFDANGGDDLSVQTKVVRENSTFGTLPTCTKPGYTFKGWYTEETEGTKIEPSTIVKITSDQTLYAQWEPNILTIKWKINGGYINSDLYGEDDGYLFSKRLNMRVANKIEYDNPISDTGLYDYDFIGLYRTGYTFKGWSTSINGESRIFGQDEYVLVSDLYPDIVNGSGEITLYAQWEPNKYTVIFAKNGGNIPSPDSITVTYDSPYGTLAICSREGYIFEGWYTEKNGGTKIESSTIVKITSNQTLYAHWTQEKAYLANLSEDTAYFKEDTYKTAIKNISFVRYVDTTKAVKTYDLSENKDNSIIGWIVKNADNTYDLYIGSDKYIYSKNLSKAFDGMTGVQNITFNNLDTRETSNMYGMFSGCSGLTSLDVTKFNTENVTHMGNMFNNCSGLTSLDVSNFTTSKVISMYGMFYECEKIGSLDVTKFNTENVTSMGAMFSQCKSLTSLDVSGFNTSNVKNMSYMFNDCSKVTELDVSNFRTANVTTMEYMFCNCSGLQSINVSNFDTSKVTNMKHMFEGLSKITTLDVSNFNTSKVTEMHEMFRGMSSLTTLDLSNFNTSSVEYKMYAMFQGCTNLKSLNISNFNTENITQMTYMFNGCKKLTHLDFRNASFDAVEEAVSMFLCESYEGELEIIVKDADAKAWIQEATKLRPTKIVMVSELEL